MTKSISETLAEYVNYQTTNPAEYKELKGTLSFHFFREILNSHLQADKGISTLPLIFGKPAEFKPEDRGLGAAPSCPMTLRIQIIAQHDYRAHENRKIVGGHPPDFASIRINELMAATFGFPFSLAYRVTRAVLRLVFSPLSYLHSLHQEKRYKIDGWAMEDLRRLGWEWIDVGSTLVSCFAGLINMFHPNAIKLDSLRDYYVKRHAEAIAKNQEFAGKKKAYLMEREAIREEMSRYRRERS